MNRLTAQEKAESLLDTMKIDEDGCWIWTGTVNTDRRGIRTYGVTTWNGERYFVHRLAAHFWKGMPLDSPLQVNHHCDKEACFRPDCLYSGTQSQNMTDCARRGRHNKKMHEFCKRGHPLSGSNVYTEPARPKHRVCLACRRMRRNVNGHRLMP